jgi:hypothetical protein
MTRYSSRRVTTAILPKPLATAYCLWRARATFWPHDHPGATRSARLPATQVGSAHSRRPGPVLRHQRRLGAGGGCVVRGVHGRARPAGGGGQGETTRVLTGATRRSKSLAWFLPTPRRRQ